MEEDFEEAYSKLKETSGQEKLLKYLDEQIPERHQFVKAFTLKHTHLGHIATSKR
jgi:hypothetical protein